MATTELFYDIAVADLLPIANNKKADGWRAVQIFCTNTENGIDISYTFNKEAIWENYRIQGLSKEDPIPSIQRLYFGMFPFENEAHDLFGVNIVDMVLDFDGGFYNVSQAEPMTIISPEQKAAREKAKKIAAAKAAKAAKEAAERAASGEPAEEKPAVPVPLTDEEIEAKVLKLDPAKQEKARVALKAKQAKDIAAAKAAQAGKDGE